MTEAPAAFAIPGDITTRTGGYIYERSLLEALRAGGRDVRYLQIGGSFPDPTPADMADLIAQLRSLDRDRPVILDGFLSGTMDTAALAELDVPTVAMVHHPLAYESGLNPARRDALFQMERANLACVSHILVPSPHTAEVLSTDFDIDRNRITIARPGRNHALVAGARTNPRLILSVGIQHPRKGHDILLKALSILRGLDWQAVVVGAPHDREHADHLERLLDQLDLRPRVRLAGSVSDDELATLYGQTSIFALATRYEGYGLVFDEALLAGLPIVSCATGAVPDTVPGDAGLLVPPDDAEAFADALKQLLSDPLRRDRMATAAETAGRALPTWADTAKTVGKVLDRLAQGNRA